MFIQELSKPLWPGAVVHISVFIFHPLTSTFSFTHQVKQLDEGMILFLSSLPVRTYAVLKDIYASYESGSLIKLPKSKTQPHVGKADCKYVILNE